MVFNKISKQQDSKYPEGCNFTPLEGDAVAEWSMAPLVRENERKTKKIPGSPPAWAIFKNRTPLKLRANA